MAGEVSLEDQRAAHVQRLNAAPGRIVERLSGVDGIRRVSLFGSYARGRRDLFTDLDVLVVWETERPLLERLRFLYPLLYVGIGLDLICYTRAEFETMRDHPFLREALKDEVLLYETKPA